MINKPIADLDAADLVALVAEQAEEGRHLEFKRDLPSSSDKNKMELCADVSSFANTGGGYLLFGVDENRGVGAYNSTEPAGVPEAVLTRRAD